MFHVEQIQPNCDQSLRFVSVFDVANLPLADTDLPGNVLNRELLVQFIDETAPIGLFVVQAASTRLSLALTHGHSEAFQRSKAALSALLLGRSM